MVVVLLVVVVVRGSSGGGGDGVVGGGDGLAVAVSLCYLQTVRTNNSKTRRKLCGRAYNSFRFFQYT